VRLISRKNRHYRRKPEDISSSSRRNLFVFENEKVQKSSYNGGCKDRRACPCLKMIKNAKTKMI